MCCGSGCIKGYNAYNQALFAWDYSQLHKNIAPDFCLLPYPIHDVVPVQLPQSPHTSSQYAALLALTCFPAVAENTSSGGSVSYCFGSNCLSCSHAAAASASTSTGPVAGLSQLANPLSSHQMIISGSLVKVDSLAFCMSFYHSYCI